MKPIIKLTNAIMEGKEEKIAKMLKTCNVTLDKKEKEKVGKKLLKTVM